MENTKKDKVEQFIEKHENITIFIILTLGFLIFVSIKTLIKEGIVEMLKVLPGSIGVGLIFGALGTGIVWLGKRGALPKEKTTAGAGASTGDVTYWYAHGWILDDNGHHRDVGVRTTKTGIDCEKELKRLYPDVNNIHSGLGSYNGFLSTMPSDESCSWITL